MADFQKVVYTHHAREKFDLLARYGFPIAEKQVEETIRAPALVTVQSDDKLIAQKAISEQHVLRVVYRVEGEAAIVITLYPAHRRRYETEL